MNVPIPHLVTLALVAFAMPCVAQTGTVTFYPSDFSGKQLVRNLVVPVGTVPFNGWLFDGNQRLAHTQYRHFMSFHLAAGEHQFTVPFHSKGPDKKPILHLNIEAGGHYCVRLWQNMSVARYFFL